MALNQIKSIASHNGYEKNFGCVYKRKIFIDKSTKNLSGYDELIKHTHNNGADESGTFDRRFLLQVLSMGHSQFAQWIGAKGPNTAINNACASTPATFSIAEDWISTGRASRVIIIRISYYYSKSTGT